MAQSNINPSGQCMFEDNLMDLAAMTVKFLPKRLLVVPVLCEKILTLVRHKIDTVALVADWIHGFFNSFPFLKNASAVGAKRDDITEDLERGEGFEDLDIVALAMAFNRGSEAGEASAHYEHLDACWRFAREFRHC